MRWEDLAAGDAVFVRKLGFRRVVAVGEDTCDVDGPLTYTRDQVERLFRPVLPRDRAEVLCRLLADPSAPREEPLGPALSTRVHDAVAAGDPDTMAELLRDLYGAPHPLPPAGRHHLRRVEDAVLGELAHATERPFADLRYESRAGKPAFACVAPVRHVEAPPPPAAMPAGWSYAGGFHLFGALTVGELPSADSVGRALGDGLFEAIDLDAKPGIWHVLERRDDESGEYAAVHADYVGPFGALRLRARSVASVNIEGGSVHLVDAEIRDDDAFQQDLAAQELTHRAFGGATGGDGPVAVYAARSQWFLPWSSGPVVLVSLVY